MELSEAFNIVTTTTLMIAGMFVAINAMQRTTAMEKIKGAIGFLSNKSGHALLIGFLAIVILFSQFLGTTSSVPILIAFLCTIPDNGDISVSRLAIPVAGLTAMWQYTFPVGNSLTLPVELNSYYGAMVTDPSQTIALLDPLKLKLLPCLLVTIWTYFGFKLMPKVEANIQMGKKNAKEQEKLPLWKEIIIYIVMIADMVGLFLGSRIGEWQYVISLIGLFILAYTKSVPVPTIVKDITNDVVWMIAGILVMSSALNASGAGQVLGDAIVSLLGDNPSKLVALLIFGTATGVMTNLMSNIASRAIMVPIAAMTAISAGWNPVPFVLTVSQMLSTTPTRIMWLPWEKCTTASTRWCWPTLPSPMALRSSTTFLISALSPLPPGMCTILTTLKYKWKAWFSKGARPSAVKKEAILLGGLFPPHIQLVYVEDHHFTILVVGSRVKGQNTEIFILLCFPSNLKFGVDAVPGIHWLPELHLIISVMEGGYPIRANTLGKKSINYIQKQGVGYHWLSQLFQLGAVQGIRVDPMIQTAAGAKHPNIRRVQLP